MIKRVIFIAACFLSYALVGENYKEKEIVATLFNPAVRVGRKIIILENNKIVSFPYVNLKESSKITCTPSLISFGLFSPSNTSTQTVLVRTDSPRISVSQSKVLTSTVRKRGSQLFEVEISPNLSALQKGSILRDTLVIRSNDQVCKIDVAGIFN